MQYYHDAAYKEYLDIFKIFIEKSIFIDIRDSKFETALFKAIKGGSYSVCKYIVSKGACLKIVNIYGHSLFDSIKNSKNHLLKNYFDEILKEEPCSKNKKSKEGTKRRPRKSHKNLRLKSSSIFKKLKNAKNILKKSK